MWVREETCQGFRTDSAYYNESRGEIVLIGIFLVPLPSKVNFGLLVQRKVNERVRNAHHTCAKSVVEGAKALTLLDYAHGFEEVHRVFGSVVILTHCTENFSLHPSAYHPKWVRYTVADNAG